MATLYIPFNVEYKDLQGNWQTYSEELTRYTLPNDPLSLRVNFKSEKLSGMYLSEYNVQWSVGDHVMVRGPELTYNYTVPGNKKINVYIARSDGLVISKGQENGDNMYVQNPIRVKVKNILQTNVRASASGPSVSSVPIDTSHVYMITEHASRSTTPITIYTQHTWQLYDETTEKYKVSLHADQAGKRDTPAGGRGYISAPLKTSSYFNNKYAQFQKTWKFTADAAGGTPVDSVHVQPTKIYARIKDDKSGFELCGATDPGAVFAGTSGSADVYYMDDSTGNVNDNNEREVYRLMFQMDTTGWPDSVSNVHMNTKHIKQAEDYVVTPQHYQAPHDYMLMNVTPASASQIVFTSTGIAGHNMSPTKYTDTSIPFVMSLADDLGNIIKHDDKIIPGHNESIIPWDMQHERIVDLSAAPVYYVGLSSSTTNLDAADFHIGANNKIIQDKISTYSSLANSLTCTKPAENVVLVGMLSSTKTGLISGTSDPFTIHPSSGKNRFFKHGEETDYGEIFNSYILQENVNQHSRLTNMFDSIFGNFEDKPEQALGKVLYEKIHNFTQNVADLDTCGVEAMYGLADQVDHELTKYNMSYPGGVKRLVDMLSVGIRKLVGDRNKYDDDFTDQIVHYDSGKFRHGRNISTQQLSTDTYMVTAGHVIVAKELYGNNAFKITPSYIHSEETTDEHYVSTQNLNGLSSYPLSGYDHTWNWGLTFPDENNFDSFYEFYEFIHNDTFPTSSFPQSHGLINWDDTNRLATYHDTLSEQTTGYDQWYAETGVIQTSFEHAIRSGLQLFNK